MRIACPSCSAAYEVPDALLAAGPRLLRCARCGAQFTAEGSPPPPEPAPPEPPPPESPPEPPQETAPPARDRPAPTRGPTRHSPIDAPPTAEPEETPSGASPGRLAAAWLGSFALLGALVFAALHWRAEIAAAWPPAARLYAALGLG
jgi:predicted Zn finger-like uncharacterized protein